MHASSQPQAYMHLHYVRPHMCQVYMCERHPETTSDAHVLHVIVANSAHMYTVS